MLEACRKHFVHLTWFALSNIVLAAQPSGYWVLENTNNDMPFGGLKLDKPKHFELLMYDTDCQLYQAEGGIKQKSEHTWELKSAVDHSNTFIMTMKARQLQLIDTEGVRMLFLKTTPEKLKQGISQHCHNHRTHNNKAE